MSTSNETVAAQPLHGKIAIVTGGGRGIGRAHAHALAAHGARVVVNAASDSAEAVAAEIRAMGCEAIAHRGSVADPAQAEALIRTTVGHFAGVDILVNNAGVNMPKLLLDTSPEDFDRVMAINLRGHFNTIQQAARLMMAARNGRIINTASGSWRNPVGNLAYAASKAAVVNLTWAVAWELRNSGVTCNAVAPFAMTRMAQQGAAAYSGLAQAGLMPSGAGSQLAAYPRPELAAPIVVYLASDAAAGITGLVFRAGGGKVAVYSHPQEINPIENEISDGSSWTFEQLAERVPGEVLKGVRPWWDA